MRTLTLFLGCLFLVGCQAYYKITDLSTGKTYYTRGWLPGMYGRCNTLNFTELGTGDHLALPASRVREVTEEEAFAVIRNQKPSTRPTD